MSAQCWEPGSEWALAAAKQSLVSRFLVVGVTEQFESFIEVSEVIIIFLLLIFIITITHHSHKASRYVVQYPDLPTLGQGGHGRGQSHPTLVPGAMSENIAILLSSYIIGDHAHLCWRYLCRRVVYLT